MGKLRSIWMLMMFSFLNFSEYIHSYDLSCPCFATPYVLRHPILECLASIISIPAWIILRIWRIFLINHTSIAKIFPFISWNLIRCKSLTITKICVSVTNWLHNQFKPQNCESDFTSAVRSLHKNLVVDSLFYFKCSSFFPKILNRC